MTAPPSAIMFREMASMLGWAPQQEVWMLYGFFDESGEHPNGADLECLTIGGCIATADEWGGFSAAWDIFREEHGVDHFHANELRDETLEAAANVITQHVRHLFGVSVHIPPKHRPDLGRRKPKKRALQAFYEHSAVDMIWHAGRHAGALGEDVVLVFAEHPDFSLSRLAKHFGEFQAADPRLDSVTVGRPERMVQLQAADLVAYEVSRFRSNLDASIAEKDQLRSPMRVLAYGANFEVLEWSVSPPTLSRKFFLSHPLPPNDG
jgi:hypothetical protein